MRDWSIWSDYEAEASNYRQSDGGFTGRVFEVPGCKGNDLLLAVEVPSGYFLTRYDEIVEQQLKLGLEFMRDYKQTFRALAKRD